MKVKLDGNIPLRVRPALEALGHDVGTVAGEDVAAWTGHIVVAKERKLRVRRR